MSLQQRITALAQAFAADIKALTTGKLNTNGIAADSSKLAGTLANEYYKRSNVLGAVSQSGGVPTGAIIERGSNANGDYVRFADGTQECWVYTAASTAQGDTTGFGGSWTFPATFATTPTVFPFVRVADNSDDIHALIAYRSATATSVRVVGKKFQEPGAVFIGARAVGRWY